MQDAYRLLKEAGKGNINRMVATQSTCDEEEEMLSQPDQANSSLKKNMPPVPFYYHGFVHDSHGRYHWRRFRHEALHSSLVCLGEKSSTGLD